MQKGPARVQVNRIEIAYDTFGDPAAPPLLLIMGLGAQMIAWHEAFCTQLAAHGYRVIRFDNRDAGLSTHFTQAGAPSFLPMAWAHFLGRPIPAPYTLRDMAGDAAGLLDALNARPAHIAGISLGGMIAQIMAVHYPQYVRTLTSMLSTTGERGLPLLKPRALVLFSRPPQGRAACAERSIRLARALRGPRFPLDEAQVRAQAQRAYERTLPSDGAFRQLAAVLAYGSRKEELKAVRAPALVIHGTADPLLPVQHGIATARAIPGARLQLIAGLGHELPPGAWPEVIGAIARHAGGGPS